jgi:hypothetical protein
MKIKPFWKYIGEQAEDNNSEDKPSYEEVKKDLGELIEKSLKTSDQKTQKDFISAYLRDPDKTQIEGLINDSDIYEFYLKYRNTVDEVLSDSNFFEEKPSDMESFGLYDYVVNGTKKAIKSFLEMIDKGQSE